MTNSGTCESRGSRLACRLQHVGHRSERGWPQVVVIAGVRIAGYYISVQNTLAKTEFSFSLPWALSIPERVGRTIRAKATKKPSTYSPVRAGNQNRPQPHAKAVAIREDCLEPILNMVTVPFHGEACFSPRRALVLGAHTCWGRRGGGENHSPHHWLLGVLKNNCVTSFYMDTAFAQNMFKSNCLPFPRYKIHFDSRFNYR